MSRLSKSSCYAIANCFPLFSVLFRQGGATWHPNKKTKAMAGKGNGGAGGDGGSFIWSILWFLILIFVGFWLGGFCAGFHILFQPFSVCIEGCSVLILKITNKNINCSILIRRVLPFSFWNLYRASKSFSSKDSISRDSVPRTWWPANLDFRE